MLFLMLHFGGILAVIAPVSSVGNGTSQSTGTAELGGIQEIVEILQGNVLTLTKLVNVMNQKVDTNTRTVSLLGEKIDTTIKTMSKLDQKVVTNSEALTSLSKKVDSTSSTMSSFKKEVDSKFRVAEKRVDSKFKNMKQEADTNRKSIKSFSGYCNLEAEDVCGPCLCKDDPSLSNNHYCDCSHLPAKRDCQQFRLEGAKTSGVYTIHQNNLRIIRVFCDQQTDGGGWTVFQRRRDGSEKFYRDWEDYRDGFGSLQNEFWLGNRNLHSLTSQGIMGNELRIEIHDWFGVRKFAKYSSFQIASEIAKFQLNVGGYSGDAGDAMTGHNGHKFTTYDNDNDLGDGNCAITCYGAYWYHNCYQSNLNGVYYDYGKMGNKWTGIHWSVWHGGGTFSFKFTEMKLRRKV